jgi:hypothetical protein
MHRKLVTCTFVFLLFDDHGIRLAPARTQLLHAHASNRTRPLALEFCRAFLQEEPGIPFFLVHFMEPERKNTKGSR